MKRSGLAVAAVGCGLLASGVPGWGQAAIGRIRLEDATVTGPLEVSAGTASVRGGVAIVAKDHTAELQLTRGGVVDVCQTSGLHVTAANNVSVAAPLLLALDRGALEVRMTATQRDGLMTPDLRLTPKGDGTLDLRIRTTSNGDTCVENRGDRAPVLEVTEQFGEGRYEIQPGQHVLFEHGSVREVVDREGSPCGCPAAPVVSVAKSGIAAAPGAPVAAAGGAAAQSAGTVAKVEEQHPFPAAESQGLVPATPPAASVPQAPAGEVHAQVAATMAFTPGADAAGTPSAAKPGQPAAAATAVPAPVVAAPALSGSPSAGQGGGAGAAAVPSPASAANGAPPPTVESSPASTAVPSPSRAASASGAVASVPANVTGRSGVAKRVRESKKPAAPAPAPAVPVQPASDPAATSGEVRAQSAPPPKTPGTDDLAHALGHFFRKLFGRGHRS